MKQIIPQISGLGVVSCVGLGVDSLWKSAMEDHSGIEKGLGMISSSDLGEIQISFPQIAKASKPVLIAYAAITEAMKQAGWGGLEENDGLILATTTGQIPVWERGVVQFLGGKISPTDLSQVLRHQSLGAIGNAISQLLHFHGSSLMVSSACCASTQALALASLWLSTGKVRRCLVGGVEVLCNLTIEGFRSLQLLSPELSRPFDLNRKGINLSEAAAFLCLEPADQAKTQPLAYLSGHGFSSDGYHMTAPHPEGTGILKAMKGALHTAHLRSKEISWIHAHGTGSRANDLAEGRAIYRLLGADLKNTWVSSTKRIHGHALGASGALETALCVKALQNQVVLKTSGLSIPDPEIPLHHPARNSKSNLQHIMKTTLGFGGTNAALILSSADVGALG